MKQSPFTTMNWKRTNRKFYLLKWEKPWLAYNKRNKNKSLVPVEGVSLMRLKLDVVRVAV